MMAKKWIKVQMYPQSALKMVTSTVELWGIIDFFVDIPEMIRSADAWRN